MAQEVRVPYTGDINYTTALQNAINSANGGGRVILDPGQQYRFWQPLTFNRYFDIEISGPGGGFASNTKLRYEGSGAAGTGAINILSSQGIAFKNMRLTYANSQFRGSLVRTGHNASGVDSMYLTFERCTFSGEAPSGTYVTSAETLLDLPLCIISKVEQCLFMYAGRAIRGARSGAYSNVIVVNASTFAFMNSTPILGPGEMWTIAGCTFEPLRNGRAGAVEYDPAGTVSMGFSYRGNWHGDVSQSGSSWIRVLAMGADISGNYFLAGDHAIELKAPSQGVHIAGNRFQNQGTSIRAIDSSTHGVAVLGNQFLGVNTGVNPTWIGNLSTSGNVGGGMS